MTGAAGVTFLMTDVEGSTRLWEERPAVMRTINARHDELVADVVTASGGRVERGRAEGDSAFAVFDDPVAGAEGALALQLAIRAEGWTGGVPVRVRMAVHTRPLQEGGDLYGPAVNRCARLRGIGHGGQILLSAATASLVENHLAPDSGLVDLGTHRLKDLAQPEHVFQLTHAELPMRFPALRSLDQVRHNLPVPGARLVGRSDALADVAALLTTSRLVTLTGSGGIGKTRLALEAAAQQVGFRPDGVWFVDLSPLTAGAEVGQAVSDAFSLQEQPGRRMDEVLVDHLRSKQALLVLDNCEHVVESVAAVTERVLADCPRVQVLATSRGSLHVRGERIWVVPPLAVDNTGADAVALFEDRCRRPLGADERLDALAICRRLDGVPLAIEMAAARVGPLSVPDVLRSMSHSLDSVLDDAPTRQQTMRATIAWSYDLLSEDERRMFRAVAIFGGGFTLGAAEAVVPAAGVPDDAVLDLLASLAQQSLVMVDAGGAEARYRLLESVKEYAQEHADSRTELPLRHRYLEWCTELAEQAQRAWTGGDALSAMDLLETEHDNVRVALDLEAVDEDADLQLRLARALKDFWNVRGHWSEGRRRLELVLARSARPGLARGVALLGAGQLAERSGDIAAALRHLHSAVAGFSLLVDDPTVTPEDPSKALANRAIARLELGRLALGRGELEAARAAYEGAVADSAAADYRSGEAAALVHLGTLDFHAGAVPSARRRWDAASLIYRTVGDTLSLAAVLPNVAAAAQVEGRYQEAMALLNESLALRSELGDRRGVADTLLSLASVARLSGSEEAEGLAHRAVAAGDELGDPLVRAVGLCELARLALARGDIGRGEELATQAGLAGSADHRVDGGVAQTLAEVERAAGRLAAARVHLEHAVAIARAGGDAFMTVDALIALGAVLAEADDPEAVRPWEEAVALLGTMVYPAGQAQLAQEVAVAVERSPGQSWLIQLQDAVADYSIPAETTQSRPRSD